MLRILDGKAMTGGGLSRREVMRVGGLGALGLAWPDVLAAREATAGTSSSRDAGFGRAKSCLLLWMLGGPPQHETWDPKPDAPIEVRGELGSIATNVPGIRVGELMPRTARFLDRLAVLRAVSTRDNAHTSSGYALLTGQVHPLGKNLESMPLNDATDWPSIGAVVGRHRATAGGLPGSITLPEIIYNNPRVVWPGQNGGFLGRAADPWLVECGMAADELTIPQLELPGDLPPLRLARRNTLLEQVDGYFGRVEDAGSPGRHGGLHRRAFDLLSRGSVRRAFDLGKEDPRLRDRYGRHKWGQCILLARRLIEAGVPIVQVNWPRDSAANEGNPGWDIHNDGYNRLKNHLMPPMDVGYTALLADLESRRLLDETLVVWMGEFGRTPRLDPGGSRNHWGAVFSVVLAGAGIRGGAVHGASDRIGAFPKDGLVEPADLAATIFHALGIDPTTEIKDPLGRPMPISRGRVLKELYA